MPMMSPAAADTCWSEAAAAVSHNSYLPEPFTARIRPREKVALGFLLAFLEAERLPAQLLLSGGYVRDLLLGMRPVDLDVSLCLRECPSSTTLCTIVSALPAFAEAHPELGVSSVSIIDTLSEAARAKCVETAKLHLQVGEASVAVDLMPTIGSESYDDADRIPVRDVRGTAEQDALRRDLTVGSMMLRVSRARRPPPQLRWNAFLLAAAAAEQPWAGRDSYDSLGSLLLERTGLAGGGGDAAPVNCAEAAAGGSLPPLRFKLLDFYGGLADLRAGVLRSPVPRKRPSEQLIPQVWDEVMRSDPDLTLAAHLGLCPQAAAATLAASSAQLQRAEMQARRREKTRLQLRIPFLAEGGFFAAAAADETAGRQLLQVLWWVKVLRDDPLRLVRALRFAATLGFRLHNSFELAVPFVAHALQTKVAGTRKVAELRKVAKAGKPALLAFLEGCFGHALVKPPPLGPGEQLPPCAELRCLAASVFGEPTPSSARAQAAAAACAEAGGAGEAAGCAELRRALLYDPERFDAVGMRSAAEALSETLPLEAAMGATLAAAFFSCGSPHAADRREARQAEEECPPPGADADADARAAAAAALLETRVTCEALQAPTLMRRAAEGPLCCALALLSPPSPLGEHALAAEACGLEPAEVAALLHMWEMLKLNPAQEPSRRLPCGEAFVISLAATRCAPHTAARLLDRLQLLRRPGPRINGKAVNGLAQVPPHLRAPLLALTHVLARARGEAPEIDSAEQLEAYLGTEMLESLHDEWHDETGGVRAEYGKGCYRKWWADSALHG